MLIRVIIPEPTAQWDERVIFVCRPLADCLLALYLLANGIESGSEAGRQRLAGFRARLTPEQMQAVSALFDAAFPIGMLAFDLLHRLPDAAALAASIRALPDSALVAGALSCGGNLSMDAPRSPGVLQSLASDPAWARDYLRRFLFPTPANPEQILAAIAQPAAVRQRLARLLDELSHAVFAPLLPALASAAHIADARMRALFARDPAAFIAAHVPASDSSAYETLPSLCSPSAFLGAGWVTVIPARSHGNGGDAAPCSIAYGTETVPEPAAARADVAGDIVPEIAPPEMYQELHRLLGDPARWALIRLLVARPCYGQELSELLGLSIATVSHHLNGLKKLDLVRIEREEHRLYYHLRLDRLRALLAGGEQQLTR